MDSVEENTEFNNKVNELYFKNYLLSKEKEEIKEELGYDVEMYKLFLRNTALIIQKDIGFLSLGDLDQEVKEIINISRSKYHLKDEWKNLENAVILDMNKVTSRKEELSTTFIEKENNNREVEFSDWQDFVNALVYDFYILMLFTHNDFVGKDAEVNPLYFPGTINSFIKTFPELFKEEPYVLVETRLILEAYKDLKDKDSKKLAKKTTKNLNNFRKRENL